MYAEILPSTRRATRLWCQHASRSTLPVRHAKPWKANQDTAQLEVLAWWLSGRLYAEYPRTISWAQGGLVEKWRAFRER